MSARRQNLSVWVDETPTLHSNRVARVVQMSGMGTYEISGAKNRDVSNLLLD